jgi:hypothetical protein
MLNIIVLALCLLAGCWLGRYASGGGEKLTEGGAERLTWVSCSVFGIGLALLIFIRSSGNGTDAGRLIFVLAGYAIALLSPNQ